MVYCKNMIHKLPFSAARYLVAVRIRNMAHESLVDMSSVQASGSDRGKLNEKFSFCTPYLTIARKPTSPDLPAASCPL